ncbi:MAG: 2-phosphosulfolactate phosphatase, partial [Planctomycetota bacterium]
QVEAAFQFASEFSSPPLLCGERHCQRMEGFDLGNSPADYTEERVAGREMVLTTTNGTRAIAAVDSARRLLVAALGNLRSVVDAVATEESLCIVCSGTNGEVSNEDVLLAGGIVSQLAAAGDCKLDDSAHLARLHWQNAVSSEGGLENALRESLGGRNLIALGFNSDVQRCAEVDHIRGWVERDSSPGEPCVFSFRT